MLLSSNVIKQVSHELENCSIYPRVKITRDAQGVRAESSPDLQLINLEAVRGEAEKMLEDARDEAEVLLQQARDKVAVLEEEAYAQGYRQGEQQGELKARESWEKAWEDFRATSLSILNELEKIRAGLVEDTEAEMVDLAVMIAEKLVCRQLELHPDTIMDIIRTACDLARDCKEVTLYVPAHQLDNIIAKQGEIDARLYKTEHFAIRCDPNMEQCGCRIETEQGYIDAGLKTRTEQLRKLFKDDAEWNQ